MATSLGTSNTILLRNFTKNNLSVVQILPRSGVEYILDYFYSASEGL